MPGHSRRRRQFPGAPWTPVGIELADQRPCASVAVVGALEVVVHVTPEHALVRPRRPVVCRSEHLKPITKLDRCLRRSSARRRHQLADQCAQSESSGASSRGCITVRWDSSSKVAFLAAASSAGSRSVWRPFLTSLSTCRSRVRTLPLNLAGVLMRLKNLSAACWR